MAYKNARDILPEYLLVEIQNYIRGEIVYIPSVSDRKAAWGSKNGSKEKYRRRNDSIREMRDSGVTLEQIAGRYYLSIESVKKIVST